MSAYHHEGCSCDPTRMIPFVDARCRPETAPDPRDAEIARLRKQVEDLIVAAGGRWRRMATSTTCGETWEQYALERDAEIAAQRAEIKRMCEERDSAQRCIEKLTAEITALRAEVDRLHTQRGDDAQQLIDFAATLAIAEEDASWDALRARVAALEAVERAVREYRALHVRVEASDSMTGADLVQLGTDAIRVESALDAALAALEVPRG